MNDTSHNKIIIILILTFMTLCYLSNVDFFISINMGQNSRLPIPKASYAFVERKLDPRAPVFRPKLFNQKAYQRVKQENPFANKACLVARYLTPSFKICTYESSIDRYVSGGIRAGKGWETEHSRYMAWMLDNYGPSAIFLDIGANIGTHALYMAKKGYRVYGVEPQPLNLVKIYHSSVLSNTTSKIKLFHHTVSDERATNFIRVTRGNIGGSFVDTKSKNGLGMVKVKSILLSDILEEIVYENYNGQPLDIVMKIDIEHYECRAFLGSPKIFSDPRYVIRYILMEWTFGPKSEACPQKMLLNMTDQFLSGDFSPYTMALKHANPSNSRNWKGDMIWKHSSSKMIQLPPR